MTQQASKCFFCGKLVGTLEVHACKYDFTLPAPTVFPTRIAVWQCPGCKTYYTPDVQKCECDRVTR